MAVFDEETPGWVKALAAAAVALVAVLIAVIVTLVVVLGNDNESQGPPAATPSKSSASTSTSSSMCGLPDGKQVIPAKDPSVDWTLVDGYAVPAAADFGPGDDRGSVHTCFAHNPTGALFSAAYYMADTENPEVDVDAFSARFSRDPHTQRVLAEDANNGGDATGSELQIAGYRFVDTQRDRISLELVVKNTGISNPGRLIAISVIQVWERGDWRLIVPAGVEEPQVHVVNDVAAEGYTVWGEL